MKKARKALLTLCAALLLVSMTVGATVAYLTSTTNVVKNTFSVGNVKITLDEAKVNLDGTYVTDATNRTDENEYKLMPGHTYIKDPTVHVDASSEEAWLFVKITNDIATIEDTTTIADQMAANWTLVSDTDNVYAYNTTVTGGENIVVFEGFKIKDDVENEALAGFNGKTITVQAYAVQKDGFNTAEEAWADAPSDWTVPATGN